MNTQSTEDRADDALRDLLAQIDPEAGASREVPAHLLDRVRTAALTDPAPAEPAAESGAGTPTSLTERPSFLARHWQGALMAAASVATLALAAGTVLPGLAGSMGGSDSGAVSESVATDVAAGAPDALAREEAAAAAPGVDLGAEQDAAAAVPGVDEAENTLVRWGSLLVGTDDVTGGRNAFVATVLQMGGRVTSETVVTEDSSGRVDPYVGDSLAASRDMGGVSYPYPWYPTGPGIWLSVEVPVEDYDEAIEAARATGEVVQMQQSSYDVGTQISDVDARIEALEASLARLSALMDEANDISDVIALEQAIAQRQSELDSLRAQQRDLANQTAMSQISLTLMSPEDARQGVDPTPDQTWWESFLEGLAQFWSWFGQALLIVSPLLIAMGIIAWVRRRRARRTAPAVTTHPPTAAAGPGGTPPAATQSGSTD
ncbi:MAG: DUF4349 domain-containing protein [Candidatus Nanopelagicales bacterium]|jgi:hypothetical protein|nr:DUF4349 domain-containing protein [Candidatus Nanopelagicales bacterium]